MSETTFIFGVSTKVVVAGVVGSAVGMVLGHGRWWEKLTRGVVGMATAYVGFGVTAKMLVGLLDIALDEKHLPSPTEMEPVAAFLIGVVGMVACQAAINAMTAVRDKADDMVETTVKDRGSNEQT